MMMFLLALIVVPFLATCCLFAVLYFRDSTTKNALLASEQARIDTQERNDRLTEALARKSGIDLVLPAPKQVALEPSPGWWDGKPKVIFAAEPVTNTRTNKEKN